MAKSTRTPWPASRFAGLSRRAAIAVLAVFVAATILCLCDSSRLHARLLAGTTVQDVPYHCDVIQQVHAGEPYYDTVRVALEKYGFRRTSLFNWRMPLYVWLLAVLPSPDWAAWVLGGMAILSVIAAVRTLLRDLPAEGVLVGLILLLAGAFAWAVLEPGSGATPEPWCEVWLLLSLSAFARGRSSLGIAFAVLALAFREFALPYCVVMAAWSCWQRRPREVLGWGIGLGAFAIYYAWHAFQVGLRQDDVSPANTSQWLQWDGSRTMLLTFTMNVILQALPHWLIAVVVPLSWLGLAGWRCPLGAQLAVIAGIYALGFQFLVGAEHWGFCNTLLTILGLVRAPAACRDLVRATFAAP